MITKELQSDNYMEALLRASLLLGDLHRAIPVHEITIAAFDSSDCFQKRVAKFSILRRRRITSYMLVHDSMKNFNCQRRNCNLVGLRKVLAVKMSSKCHDVTKDYVEKMTGLEGMREMDKPSNSRQSAHGSRALL